MKKGFTLIELLVVIAIIGILLSVMLNSIHNMKCKQNPDRDNCPQQKSKVSSENSKQDKFTRTETSVPITQTDYGFNNDGDDFNYGCSNVTDPTDRKECQDQEYHDKMIQDCVDRYSN